jgi:hypothetical protein
MQTVVLDGLDELPELYASIAEDWEAIDYSDYLYRELDLMADLHKSYFDSSTGPDGAAWAPNAPRTIQQKGHSTILRGVRGRKEKNVKGTRGRPGVRFRRSRWIGGYRLSTSLTAKTRQTFGDAIREAIATDSGGDLKFGTAVDYSPINDQGGGHIPARPHIGMTEQHLDKVTNRAADFALEQLAAA